VYPLLAVLAAVTEGNQHVQPLEIIGGLLILLWVVGFVFQFLLSPFIHLALFLGAALVIVNFVRHHRNEHPTGALIRYNSKTNTGNIKSVP